MTARLPMPSSSRTTTRRLLLGTGAMLLLVATSSIGCSRGSSDAATPSGADGAPLYAEHCASCHGADLRGTDTGPSHLSKVYEPSHHGDDSFRAAIAQGSRAHHWTFGDMAPVPGLDAAEVDAIIAYVRQQQEAEGFEPYPPS